MGSQTSPGTFFILPQTTKVSLAICVVLLLQKKTRCLLGVAYVKQPLGHQGQRSLSSSPTHPLVLRHSPISSMPSQNSSNLGTR